MTTGNVSVVLNKSSQDSVIQYLRQASQLANTRWNLRDRMREIDLAYQRENDWTEENVKAKIANRRGDPNKFQDPQIPVVKPLVESAVGFQTQLFLSGTPIFPVVSSPAYADQALALETVLDNQCLFYGWVPELIKNFRDGFKYNLAALEVVWKNESSPSFETDVSFGNGLQGKPKEVIFQGNSIRSLDLYNTFWDIRVNPTEVHKKGEYAGYVELFSRVALKEYIRKLDGHIISNVVPAFESTLNGGSTAFGSSGIDTYFLPQINPMALVNRNVWGGMDMDWVQWAQISGAENAIQYRNSYQVTTLYARILPSDFGIRVPSQNTPQVWKFVIVNNSVLLFAERQTNAHNWLPILFTQPYEDGLGYQTKSLASDLMPFQSIATALSNSAIAARRRAIQDRALFDPTRIKEAHVNAANPIAKIPVRPSAFGGSLSDAYHQIPFEDTQSQIINQQLQQTLSLANNLANSNPAKQGQFVKGNKTGQEFNEIMNNADSKDLITAWLYEHQLFQPLRYILKTNTLQYQPTTESFSRLKSSEVKVDPVKLRNAVMEFKLADGLIPKDKLFNAQAFGIALQSLSAQPDIAKGYEVGDIFAYLMKTQGANLDAFKKAPQVVMYETAVAQWQQLALQAIKQGITADKLPPQPTPQQFGIDPANPPKAEVNTDPLKLLPQVQVDNNGTTNQP